ncbi:MAG TPA: hypothetical protein VGF45_12285 [Polyangia bacterium]
MTAVAGCAVVLVHRLLDDKPTPRPASIAEDSSEVGAGPEELRAEIARLQRLVGELAAQQARLEKIQPSKPRRNDRGDEPAAAESTVPVGARVSKDMVVKQHVGAAIDPKASAQLEIDLKRQFGQPTFAEAGVAVEEVACRGDVCKVKVSHVPGAEPTFMISELAAAIPDSEGFFAFDKNGDKATIETYLLRTGASARR